MVDDLDSSILHRYDLDLSRFPSIHALLNKLGIHRHEKGTVHYNGSEARLNLLPGNYSQRNAIFCVRSEPTSPLTAPAPHFSSLKRLG
jgi:hypothetical protein